MLPHRFGCACTECCNRGRASLEEAQRIQRHNVRALGTRGRDYYDTGPRVPPASDALQRYFAYDWMAQPAPGSEEYLAITLPPPWNPAPIAGECELDELVTLPFCDMEHALRNRFARY
jgi:hypothetical protein